MASASGLRLGAEDALHVGKAFAVEPCAHDLGAGGPAVGPGIGKIDETVFGEARIDGDIQQAALAARRDPGHTGDRFRIDHTFPCLAVNRWITAMIDLFRPQIKELLVVRDKTIKNWGAAHPGIDVFEDRKLEITSIMNIDVDRQIAAVDAALGDQRKSA